GYLLTVCENGYGKRTPFGANTAGEEPAELEAEEEPEETVDEAAEATSADGEVARDRSSMRYRKQRRGGKGVRDIRTSERNGPVVGVVAVRGEYDVMLITQQGMVNRTHADEIRVTGRNAQGVRVEDLNEGDRVASSSKMARD